MNVDTQFQPAPFAGTPHRPAQRPTEQVSARPAERPHHDEAVGKQSQQESDQVAEHKNAAGQMETEARAELAKQDGNDSTATDKAPARGGFDTNPTQPASVGEFLDVVA